MGLFTPVLPGLGPIISIFAIVILLKFKLFPSDTNKINSSNNENSTKIAQPKTKRTTTPPPKTAKQDIKKHLNNEKSLELFGIENLSSMVVNSKESEYFKKIKNESEETLNVISCAKGIKEKSRGTVFNAYQSGYVYNPGEESGILILTTQNIYFLSAKGGISKEVFPINKVNGIRKIAYNALELTFGRSKKIFVIPMKEKMSNFIESYLENNY